jgi:hypothetical protein
MTMHSCTTPLDYERFLAYWFGELEPAEEEGVELQLLTCPHCGKLGETWALQTQGLGETASRLPRGFLDADEVRALGARAVLVDVSSGSMDVALNRDAVHVFRLALDSELVAGCERIDVEYRKAGYPEPVFHVSDLPPSKPGTPVHLACSGHILATHGDVTMRIVGTRAGGPVTLLESAVHFV